MNEKAFTITENVLTVFGVTLGLAQIEQILGIVLLSVQVVLILVRVGLKIYKHVKEGKLDEAIATAEEGKHDIEDLIEKGKKGESEHE